MGYRLIVPYLRCFGTTRVLSPETLPISQQAVVGALPRFAQFCRDHAESIHVVLTRSEELGARLRGKRFDHVLCHADIHGANILVGEDGRIWLVDWDGPLLDPRERDLLFVVGSRIGRHVTPREEDLFFTGYGLTAIDAEALAYYRYERRIEDLGETGVRMVRDLHLSERAREAQAAATMAFFAPDGDFAVAEIVPRRVWPIPSPDPRLTPRCRDSVS